MKKLIILSVIFVTISTILISQTETIGPTKFIFERSDGSVYEKMQGAKNFVQIVAGRENEFIIDRLANDHIKVVVNKSNGEQVYSYNFKDLYNIKDNAKIESSSNLEDLTNYSLSPNPTNGMINVSFDLLEQSTVSINIYTLGGFEIAKLINTTSDKGTFQHNFDMNRFTAGAYIYQVVINNRIYSSKIVKN